MPARGRRSGREQPAEIAEARRRRAARRRPRGAPRRRPSGRARRGAPSIVDPAQGQRLARPEGWRVLRRSRPAVAGAAAAGRSAASARREIGGRGHLEVVGSPGIAWTGMVQASSRAASSVRSRGPPAGSARRRVRAGPRRTPCGVWAAPSPARSTVAPTTSPSIRLTVSATARPGSRRRAARGRGGDRARRARGDDRRPRPVVDQDDRGRPPRRRRARRAPRAPAATDSWRRAPPATTATDAAGSHAAPRSARPGRRDATSDDPRRPRARPRSRRASRRGAAGRRSVPSELVDAGHPAATSRRRRRSASASRPSVVAGRRGRRPGWPRGPVNRGAAGRRSSGRPRSGGRGSRRRRGPGRCTGRRPRPRSSCRRRGSRRPGRPPCPPG